MTYDPAFTAKLLAEVPPSIDLPWILKTYSVNLWLQLDACERERKRWETLAEAAWKRADEEAMRNIAKLNLSPKTA